LASSSAALLHALELLRRVLPHDPNARAQLGRVERRLGRARLPEDYEEVRDRLLEVEIPEVYPEVAHDETTHLFQRVVSGLTPIARGAGHHGALAELNALRRGPSEEPVADEEIERLLAALELLTMSTGRLHDGAEVLKLTITEVVDMIGHLADDEADVRMALEDVVHRIDSAHEMRDFEELRRELLTHVSALVRHVNNDDEELISELTFEHEERFDELEAALETAHDEARTDPLTGLFNRRALEEYVKRGSPRGTEVGLLAIDLDHFKAINDRHGHPGGDRVLCAVAEMLDGALRGHDQAFRVGGEELVVLLCDTSLQAARVTAERLRAEFERTPIRHEGAAIFVTASFGVSVWNEAKSFEDALEEADDALYRAKQSGRNRVLG